MTHCYITESVYRALPQQYQIKLRDYLPILLDASVQLQRQGCPEEYFDPLHLIPPYSKIIEEIQKEQQEVKLLLLEDPIPWNKIALHLGKLSYYVSALSWCLNMDETKQEKEKRKIIEENIDQYFAKNEVIAYTVSIPTVTKTMDAKSLIEIAEMAKSYYPLMNYYLTVNNQQGIIDIALRNYRLAQTNVYLCWVNLLSFVTQETPTISSKIVSSAAPTTSITTTTLSTPIQVSSISAISLITFSKHPYINWSVPHIIEEKYIVANYDGDTLTTKDGITIRLLGIDTPEIRPRQPKAIEAKKFTEQFVVGKKAVIVYQKRYNRDKYGRLLALIFVNDKCLNYELLKNKLAVPAYLDGDYSVYTEIINTGLWETADMDQKTSILFTSTYTFDNHSSTIQTTEPLSSIEDVNKEAPSTSTIFASTPVPIVFVPVYISTFYFSNLNPVTSSNPVVLLSVADFDLSTDTTPKTFISSSPQKIYEKEEYILRPEFTPAEDVSYSEPFLFKSYAEIPEESYCDPITPQSVFPQNAYGKIISEVEISTSYPRQILPNMYPPSSSSPYLPSFK